MTGPPSEPAPRLRNGMRHRGRSTTRLEAFVDAAFAFAVTLLVISIDTIPDSLEALVAALKGVPAFAVSFAMLALFWSAHARWSRHYGLDDTVSTTLSLSLVFLVLVYVYPLKMLFGTFFAWISQGWLPSPLRVVRGLDDIAAMFMIYGIVFATLSAIMAGLYMHAWRQRRRLALDPGELALTAGDIGQFVWFILVGLASTLTAALMLLRAGWLSGLPGMLYCLLAFTGLIHLLARQAVLRRLAAAAATGADAAAVAGHTPASPLAGTMDSPAANG